MIPKCIIMPEYDEAEMGKAISASILENSRGVDVGADALHDHLQSHQIAATLQDDDVGKFAAWLHILLVHGFYRGEVLGDNRLERPAPFLHIPQSTAEDADVGIRLHEDLVSNMSRRVGFWKIRMPSTMITLVGRISRVSSVRLCST